VPKGEKGIIETKGGKVLIEKYKLEDMMINVDDLQIDFNYQRNNLSEDTVTKIIRDFNWFSFGNLMVSIRDNGDKFVIDGSHRLEAAKRKSILQVPCKVAHGLTIYEEAELCRYMLENRKNPNLAENIKAAYMAGDPRICHVYDILMKHNLKLGFMEKGRGTVSSRREGRICCFSAIFKAYDRGPEYFDFLFETLYKLWFDDEIGKWQQDALRQQAINGLSFFLFYAKKTDHFDIQRLINNCSGPRSIAKYMTLARNNSIIVNWGTPYKHLALAMLADYNRRLPDDKKLDLAKYS